MATTKSLIGLEQKHIELLESMVDKKDKRFKNKSAVVRTLLDCFCSENKKVGKATGVIVVKSGGCSAYNFDKKSYAEDLLEGANSIKIMAVKDSGVSCSHPKIEIECTYSDTHRL